MFAVLLSLGADPWIPFVVVCALALVVVPRIPGAKRLVLFCIVARHRLPQVMLLPGK